MLVSVCAAVAGVNGAHALSWHTRRTDSQGGASRARRRASGAICHFAAVLRVVRPRPGASMSDGRRRPPPKVRGETKPKLSAAAWQAGRTAPGPAVGRIGCLSRRPVAVRARRAHGSLPPAIGCRPEQPCFSSVLSRRAPGRSPDRAPGPEPWARAPWASSARTWPTSRWASPSTPQPTRRAARRGASINASRRV